MSKKPKFKPGDTVKLKSGGPDMTVLKLLDSMVTCVWFNKGDVKERGFELALVEKVKRVQFSNRF